MANDDLSTPTPQEEPAAAQVRADQWQDRAAWKAAEQPVTPEPAAPAITSAPVAPTATAAPVQEPTVALDAPTMPDGTERRQGVTSPGVQEEQAALMHQKGVEASAAARAQRDAMTPEDRAASLETQPNGQPSAQGNPALLSRITGNFNPNAEPIHLDNPNPARGTVVRGPAPLSTVGQINAPEHAAPQKAPAEPTAQPTAQEGGQEPGLAAGRTAGGQPPGGTVPGGEEQQPGMRPTSRTVRQGGTTTTYRAPTMPKTAEDFAKARSDIQAKLDTAAPGSPEHSAMLDDMARYGASLLVQRGLDIEKQNKATPAVAANYYRTQADTIERNLSAPGGNFRPQDAALASQTAAAFRAKAEAFEHQHYITNNPQAFLADIEKNSPKPEQGYQASAQFDAFARNEKMLYAQFGKDPTGRANLDAWKAALTQQRDQEDLMRFGATYDKMVEGNKPPHSSIEIGTRLAFLQGEAAKGQKDLAALAKAAQQTTTDANGNEVPVPNALTPKERFMANEYIKLTTIQAGAAQLFKEQKALAERVMAAHGELPGYLGAWFQNGIENATDRLNGGKERKATAKAVWDDLQTFSTTLDTVNMKIATREQALADAIAAKHSTVKDPETDHRTPIDEYRVKIQEYRDEAARKLAYQVGLELANAYFGGKKQPEGTEG